MKQMLLAFYATRACVWEAARVSPTRCNLQTLQDRVMDGLCEPIAADEGVGTTCSVHRLRHPPDTPPTDHQTRLCLIQQPAPAPALTSKPESLKDGCADDDDNGVS